MKKLLTNRQYLILNVVIGSAIGFFNCFATQSQQMLCAVGYSAQFSGLLITVILLIGLCSSMLTGFIAAKTGKFLETTKIFICLSCIVVIVINQLFRKPDVPEWIMTFGVL